MKTSGKQSITCPECGLTSSNPNDAREGYCGNCHDWTSRPKEQTDAMTATPNYIEEWDDRKITSFYELALFLGGDETSFTGILLTLIAKADPFNFPRLRGAFPAEVAAWKMWKSMSPAPTFKELRHALAEQDAGSMKLTLGIGRLNLQPTGLFSSSWQMINFSDDVLHISLPAGQLVNRFWASIDGEVVFNYPLGPLSDPGYYDYRWDEDKEKHVADEPENQKGVLRLRHLARDLWRRRRPQT